MMRGRAGALAGASPIDAAPAALLVALAAGQVEQHVVAPDAWQVATETVADGARDGDAILFGTIATRPPFEAAWRGVEAAPTLDPVGDDRPLGEVRRFEDDEIGDDARWEAARASGRVWVVGNPSHGEPFPLALVVDPSDGRPASHQVVERSVEPSSGMSILLLEPV